MAIYFYRGLPLWIEKEEVKKGRYKKGGLVIFFFLFYPLGYNLLIPLYITFVQNVHKIKNTYWSN